MKNVRIVLLIAALVCFQNVSFGAAADDQGEDNFGNFCTSIYDVETYLENLDLNNREQIFSEKTFNAVVLYMVQNLGPESHLNIPVSSNDVATEQYYSSFTLAAFKFAASSSLDKFYNKPKQSTVYKKIEKLLGIFETEGSHWFNEVNVFIFLRKNFICNYYRLIEKDISDHRSTYSANIISLNSLSAEMTPEQKVFLAFDFYFICMDCGPKNIRQVLPDELTRDNFLAKIDENKLSQDLKKQDLLNLIRSILENFSNDDMIQRYFNNNGELQINPCLVDSFPYNNIIFAIKNKPLDRRYFLREHGRTQSDEVQAESEESRINSVRTSYIYSSIFFPAGLASIGLALMPHLPTEARIGGMAAVGLYSASRLFWSNKTSFFRSIANTGLVALAGAAFGYGLSYNAGSSVNNFSRFFGNLKSLKFSQALVRR